MLKKRLEMSKIQFEQISDDVLEVVFPPNTPMEMVEQLSKSFRSKGLVEDVANSTLSIRYFYRPEDKANALADKLIKSLESLTKDDSATAALPHWHPKAQMAHQKKLREQAIAERRVKNGVTPGNVSPKPEPNTVAKPSPSPHVGAKMYDTDRQNQMTAGGTGKRYAFIKDPETNKGEDHPEDCDCAKCQDMEKSGYGPKGMSQYNPADNARRKANNTGDMTGFGHNVNTKSYGSKPGRIGGKAEVNLASRIQNAANKKQPIKTWTPEQIAEENKKRGFKKSWGEHNPIPSAEEEIMRLAKAERVNGEVSAANQLASLMHGKQMLGKDVHPAVAAMMAPPPPQPTDEQMFGHLAVTEDMAKAADQQWHGTLNNWLVEASKPISQRFASEEEEVAYWSKLKVADKDDGSSGY
jgi:hypothetical protein